VVSHTANGVLSSVETLEASESTLPVEVLSEKAFQRLISQERKRSERSQRPFVLLLVDTDHTQPDGNGSRGLLDILQALQVATRETDFTGWYKKESVVGVMFTEIVVDRNLVLSTILSRISAALRDRLGNEQFSHIKFSFHVFPDDWDNQDPTHRNNPTLYPDLENREKTNQVGRALKRVVDVLGSACSLIVLSPVFLLIAAAIKITSKGPALFRQTRVGELGVPFSLLKFRTMDVDNDPSQHQEYVRQLIAGHAERHVDRGNSNGEGVFKLTDDPRITSIGKFLRRSSLDELPQLINVMQGDMSLVGPRPPLPYEVEAYAPWHRRRLLEAKPGITGLWQVCGRSRVGFDEMVRLDLRYARDCSPWLDLKILLRTPRAVIGGDGAS
jgi:lipopolysaccharide/colanic/teichoic acid biosynthesis glycosyltransferase